MGSINIFKIDNRKVQILKNIIEQEYEIKGTKRENGALKESKYEFTLYMEKKTSSRKLSWKWLAEEFEVKTDIMPCSPKAILFIEVYNGEHYAITCGHSYHLIDKYADKDFGLNFARKIEYEEVKTTAVSSPGMKRNKMISSYLNYGALETESGVAYTKIKLKMDSEESEGVFKPTVEIGTSIIFNLEQDSLSNIIGVIEYVLRTMEQEDITEIPVFRQVKDEAQKRQLDELLAKDILEDKMRINISEFDVVGARVEFNDITSEYVLKYNRHIEKGTGLDEKAIKNFCEKYEIINPEEILQITIEIPVLEGTKQKKVLKEIIDYNIDGEKYFISKGIWYEYNDDYIKYLDKSLDRIPVKYNPEYDFLDENYHEYIKDKILKDKKIFNEQNEKKYRAKYYAERFYNDWLSEKGFINFDRNIKNVNGHKFEPMDLFKDGCMYAVKIGSTSSKLCYTVEQSLSSLHMYDDGIFVTPNGEEITKIALWFVLDDSMHIEDDNGKTDLKRMKLLMLKNSLDSWSKNVRLLNYEPIIYINYRR